MLSNIKKWFFGGDNDFSDCSDVYSIEVSYEVTVPKYYGLQGFDVKHGYRDFFIGTCVPEVAVRAKDYDGKVRAVHPNAKASAILYKNGYKVKEITALSGMELFIGMVDD